MRCRSDVPAWAKLPFDLLAEVVKQLPHGDFEPVSAVRLTCRDWYFAMQQTASTLAPKTAEVPAAYASLHSLDLTRSCPLTQPGQLAALAQLTGLRRLSLTAPDAQTEQLIAAELPRLTQITALDLSGSRELADDVLDAARQLTRLQELALRACIACQGPTLVKLLGSVPGLERLLLKGHSNHRCSEDSTMLCAGLAELRQLRHLDLRGQSSVTLQGLASLRSLRHLQALSLEGCPAICDQGLRLIACHTGLRQLSLQQASKTAAPLREDAVALLGSLTRLESLGLSSPVESGVMSSWTNLKSLTQLTALDLTWCNAKDSSTVGHLVSCFPLEQLRVLNLSSSGFSGTFTPQVARAKGLQSLDISRCPHITAESLSSFSVLCQLESLRMDDCVNLIPSCSRPFAFMTGLQRLTELSWSATASAGSWMDPALHSGGGAISLLEHAAHLTGLKRLGLKRQCLEPYHDCMGHLRALTALTQLDLSETHGAPCPEDMNHDLSALSALTNLEALCLSETDAAEGLGHFCSCMLALVRLDLSGTPVADADLHALRALPRLRALLINRQPIRDDITNAGLAHIAQLPGLTCLELQGNCTITANGLQQLSQLSNLGKLNLRGCLGVRESSALRRLQGCTALQELYIGELDGVSYHPSSSAIPAVRRSQLDAFRRRMPFLRTLSLSAEMVDDEHCNWLERTSYTIRSAVELASETLRRGLQHSRP